MVTGPGTEPWNYIPVTVECDLCHKVMNASDAQDHAFDHWDDV